MTRCPKCRGCLETCHEETRCINCGWREGDLTRELGREGAAEHPSDDLCSHCRKQPRMMHRRCCKTCLYRSSQRQQARRRHSTRTKESIAYHAKS
jgi:hypothetical protein